MARILFISGDVGGNIPPTLAIAAELVRRGHEVGLAGAHPRDGSPFPAGILEVPLHSLDALDVARAPGRLGHLPALTRMAIGSAVARDVRILLATYGADAVVVDGIMLRSLREAVDLGVPTAVLFHSLGAFWAQGMANPLLNVVLRPAGLAPLRLLQRADALLLPTDPVLDPAARGKSPIAFEWLGTTEPGAEPAPREPGSDPLVLASFSSAWQRNQGDVYRRVMQALAPLPVRAIVTTGGVEVDGALDPPPNIEVRGRVSHSEILPHADLVIGHGGHSTTMKALAHGVPLLILPMDTTSDQPMIGRVVEAAGLGRSIRRSSSVEIIRLAARQILENPVIHAAAADTGTRLRAQNGAAAGADAIEALAG